MVAESGVLVQILHEELDVAKLARWFVARNSSQSEIKCELQMPVF